MTDFPSNPSNGDTVDGENVTYRFDAIKGAWIATNFANAPRGPKGDSGITISATPPASPNLNDLWLDIS